MRASSWSKLTIIIFVLTLTRQGRDRRWWWCTTHLLDEQHHLGSYLTEPARVCSTLECVVHFSSGRIQTPARRDGKKRRQEETVRRDGKRRRFPLTEKEQHEEVKREESWRVWGILLETQRLLFKSSVVSSSLTLTHRSSWEEASFYLHRVSHLYVPSHSRENR